MLRILLPLLVWLIFMVGHAASIEAAYCASVNTGSGFNSSEYYTYHHPSSKQHELTKTPSRFVYLPVARILFRDLHGQIRFRRRPRQHMLVLELRTS